MARLATCGHGLHRSSKGERGRWPPLWGILTYRYPTGNRSDLLAVVSPVSGKTLTQNRMKLVVAHKARSTGTVQTSAKARLTSVAIRIRLRIRIRDPDRHQNLTNYCSLAARIVKLP